MDLIIQKRSSKYDFLSIRLCFVFQACTGIEDVGKAIEHLEAANWSLVVSYIYFYTQTSASPYLQQRPWEHNRKSVEVSRFI